MKRSTEDGPSRHKRPKLDQDTRPDHPTVPADLEGKESPLNDNSVPKPSPGNSLDALESVLSEFTTHQEQTKSILGLRAQEHMKSLLAILRGRRASTSLETYHSPKYSLPPLSPAQTRNIRPFDYNDIPSRPFTLPELPEILPGPYSDVPFIHSSVAPIDRVSGAFLEQKHRNKYAVSPKAGKLSSPMPNETPRELNYERLEFLGDAYLGVIASNLIFSHFPHLPPGKQTTLRSNLVNNETLMHFSRAYGFDEKLQISGFFAHHMRDSESPKGNKGFNKILADVFEAYVAAIVLSDPENGISRLEKWLKELWTPILLVSQGRNFSTIKTLDYSTFLPYYDAAKNKGDVGEGTSNGTPRQDTGHENKTSAIVDIPALLPEDLSRLVSGPNRQSRVNVSHNPAAGISSSITHEPEYDPNAKAVLQKRIAPNNVRLTYKPAEETRGYSTSAAPFTVAVHLTGWGHKDLLLGMGSGDSKVEAGNRAATDAMLHQKDVVEDCERRFNEEKARRQSEKDQKLAAKRERWATEKEGEGKTASE